jgi:hypothetical protein
MNIQSMCCVECICYQDKMMFLQTENIDTLCVQCDSWTFWNNWTLTIGSSNVQCLLTQLSSMPQGELIAVTFGSWTLISSYSACTPWFCTLNTFRPHELALHNVIIYPWSTWCCSVILYENYIVSIHDLVSTTPLDFWCVSIFSVAVTKIIKIHCISFIPFTYLKL